MWQQNVGLNQLVEVTRMMSFAAKWYGSKRVEFFSEYHDGAETMVRAAHELINDADAVIHFNGTQFDMPHLRREFVDYGLGPHKPVVEIDLLKVVRSKFRLPSNKLAYVAQWLGLPGKTQHNGHELWVQCMAGDEKAWSLMRRYNVQDVRLTERVYEALRPWMHTHPNWNLEFDGDAPRCTACGSDEVQRRGFKVAETRMYQQFQCQSCGAWFRGTKAVNSTSVRGAA